MASPDMKALLHELSPIDSSEPELMDPLAVDSMRIFDTVVAAYLLDSDRSEFDEAYLADTYLQMALPAVRGAEGAGEDAPAPAARTAALTLALVAPLRDRMACENAANVFDGIEMPLVPVLAKMERAGMLVDPDRLHSLSEGLATQITEVERSIRDLAGDETFNIGSPMQLSHVLFDVMGLPTKGLKKTKRGYYSTNAKVLSDLARDHEIVRLILDWREKSKIKSTYLDTLGPLRRGDGRVHTTYNQTITATGRLSSSDRTCRTSRRALSWAVPSRRRFRQAREASFWRWTTRRSSCVCWHISQVTSTWYAPLTRARTSMPRRRHACLACRCPR
mgnify:CR=1 FL=1